MNSQSALNYEENLNGNEEKRKYRPFQYHGHNGSYQSHLRFLSKSKVLQVVTNGNEFKFY